MSNELNLDQLAATQKANAEVMMSLMRTAFNGVERLAALNMSATRDFFNASVAGTQQTLAIKDPSELSKVGGALAQPNVEKMMEYSKSVYELVGQMQKEVTSVMEAQYNSFSQSANSAIEKGTKAAPVGGDVFAAAMKQMLSASTKAFDNMTSMAKQLSDIAEANVHAASNVTSKAVSATAAAAKKGK